MNTRSMQFYIWTLKNCIKDTYENWGIDMMSMYINIQKDFPNAENAIKKMYGPFEYSDYQNATAVHFDDPQFVYEVIANLVPQSQKLMFDLRTKELQDKYKELRIYSFGEYVSINRMDLLMAVLLFTEEFIFWPIKSENIIFTDSELLVCGKFVNLLISNAQGKTYIDIEVKNVLKLQYEVLNP